MLDIGAGIRPFTWYNPARHICVEPYSTYAYLLSRAGYEVFPGTALDVLRREQFKVHQILMLDVIEHMEREEGKQVIEEAKRAASEQIIVYTPMGFRHQEGDAWGLGGDVWQKHRSGWTADDFPGWEIEERTGAFFAVWNA